MLADAVYPHPSHFEAEHLQALFERQRSAFRTGACSEAWEDVAVHIDNAIWCRLGILHGPPAATGKLDFLVCTHEQDFRWKCRSVPHVPVR